MWKHILLVCLFFAPLSSVASQDDKASKDILSKLDGFILLASGGNKIDRNDIEKTFGIKLMPSGDCPSNHTFCSFTASNHADFLSLTWVHLANSEQERRGILHWEAKKTGACVRLRQLSDLLQAEARSPVTPPNVSPSWGDQQSIPDVYVVFEKPKGLQGKAYVAVWLNKNCLTRMEFHFE